MRLGNGQKSKTIGNLRAPRGIATAFLSMSALIDGDVFRKIDGIYGRGHAGGSDRASLRIASVGPRLGPVLLRVQKTVADGGRVAGLM